MTSALAWTTGDDGPHIAARSAQIAPFAGLPGDVPVPAGRDHQPLRGLRLSPVDRPTQRRPEVVEFGVEPGQAAPGGPSEHLRRRPFREIQAPLRVSLARRLCLAAEIQLLGGELPDRLQHREPRRPGPLLLPQQTLLDQRREPIEDGTRRSPSLVISANRLGRVQRAAAGEDREPPEEDLLLGRKQVVAPGDGVAHRLLTSRQIAGAVIEQRQPILQSGENVRRVRAPGRARRRVRSPAAIRPAGRRSLRPRPRSRPRARRSVGQRAPAGRTAQSPRVEQTGQRRSVAVPGTASGCTGNSCSP